jgi:hypothetical protein
MGGKGGGKGGGGGERIAFTVSRPTARARSLVPLALPWPLPWPLPSLRARANRSALATTSGPLAAASAASSVPAVAATAGGGGTGVGPCASPGPCTDRGLGICQHGTGGCGASPSLARVCREKGAWQQLCRWCRWCRRRRCCRWSVDLRRKHAAVHVVDAHVQLALRRIAILLHHDRPSAGIRALHAFPGAHQLSSRLPGRQPRFCPRAHRNGLLRTAGRRDGGGGGLYHELAHARSGTRTTDYYSRSVPDARCEAVRPCQGFKVGYI